VRAFGAGAIYLMGNYYYRGQLGLLQDQGQLNLAPARRIFTWVTFIVKGGI